MSSSFRVISKDFFLECKSLLWALFEAGSRLSRFEERAFSQSGLRSIHLSASITVIGESCFSDCGSLASITFDCASHLQEIHPRAFLGVPIEALILPGGIRHLSGSAFAETRLERPSFSPLPKKFAVSGSIVEAISGRCLIRYFGKEIVFGLGHQLRRCLLEVERSSEAVPRNNRPLRSNVKYY
jgi:hypothetical protein